MVWLRRNFSDFLVLPNHAQNHTISPHASTLSSISSPGRLLRCRVADEKLTINLAPVGGDEINGGMLMLALKSRLSSNSSSLNQTSGFNNAPLRLTVA
jgi:hypothetical protein